MQGPFSEGPLLEVRLYYIFCSNQVEHCHDKKLVLFRTTMNGPVPFLIAGHICAQNAPESF